MIEDLWDLDDFRNKENLLMAVANIPYNGLGTLIGKAINYTHDFKFLPSTGRRPNVPKVVIVLTDGESLLFLDCQAIKIIVKILSLFPKSTKMQLLKKFLLI